MTAPAGSKHTFLEGMIIQIDPDQRSPEKGQYVIAILEGEPEVNFKQFMVESGKPYLKPLNPAFPLIWDHFEVAGRVIGVIQEL